MLGQKRSRTHHEAFRLASSHQLQRIFSRAVNVEANSPQLSERIGVVELSANFAQLLPNFDLGFVCDQLSRAAVLPH